MAAFDVLEDDQGIPVGYSKLGVHPIFYVKMNLTCKAKLVANGHFTPDPVKSTYTVVISCESVRIALTYESLMGINVWGADI